MEKEYVVVVDENDREVRSEEKMSAHRNGGVLHRAFSVFIFNSGGEMLLQKRARGKYHCAGLWTNACCSHPVSGENVQAAAHRKLEQEMGFDTGLKEIFSFIYKAGFSNGLAEHELDHVFVGRFDGRPVPNPDEADGFKWVAPGELEKDVAMNPGKYTPWFKIILGRVLERERKNKPA